MPIQKIYKGTKHIFKQTQRIWGKKTRIGNFLLSVDPENSQPYILKKFPEHGTHLVRLAQAIQNQYKQLQIIDIGANFGDTVAMFLTDNSDYRVICIEGDKPTFTLLSKNFSNNPHVFLHNIFLGEKDTRVQINSNKVGGSLRLSDTSQSKSILEIVTLDSFIDKNPIYQNTKLLKIDTDGYDNRILRGARKYILHTHPILFFEYDKKYLADNNENGLDIFNYLKELGYSSILFYDNVGRFILSVDISNANLIESMDRYISDRKGMISYFDIVAFHSTDSEIYNVFLKNESLRP
jgi:FkbM family methyltransferase